MSSAVQLVRQFRDACMNEDQIETDQTTNLLADLNVSNSMFIKSSLFFRQWVMFQH